jgi:superfamily I DNA/RNA helicase
MEEINNSRKFDEILNSTAKRICVIAGPGSGKTTGILIPKAKQIITDSNVAPKNVLLLTFSRLSAIDLQNKVKSIEKVPRASTLHSFCLSFLLTEDNHEIRKRVNSIILDFEKKIMISDLKLVFPQKDKKKLRTMLDEFSAVGPSNRTMLYLMRMMNKNNLRQQF